MAARDRHDAMRPPVRHRFSRDLDAVPTKALFHGGLHLVSREITCGGQAVRIHSRVALGGAEKALGGALGGALGSAQVRARRRAANFAPGCAPTVRGRGTRMLVCHLQRHSYRRAPAAAALCRKRGPGISTFHPRPYSVRLTSRHAPLRSALTSMSCRVASEIANPLLDGSAAKNTS